MKLYDMNNQLPTSETEWQDRLAAQKSNEKWLRIGWGMVGAATVSLACLVGYVSRGGGDGRPSSQRFDRLAERLETVSSETAPPAADDSRTWLGTVAVESPTPPIQVTVFNVFGPRL